MHVMGLQLDLIWEDPEANRNQISALLKTNQPSVDLIVLPEMFSTGFSMNAAGLAESMDGKTIRWMCDEAGKYQTHLAGSIIIEVDGKYYNRWVVVNREGWLATYDKRHPFSLSGEDQIYQHGSYKTIFQINGWRICPMICYDLRFPEWSRNAPGEEERYDLLVYSANWPSKRIMHWMTLLKARAIENQAYVMGVNRVGVDGSNLNYNGYTMIIDPSGETIHCLADQPGMIQDMLDIQQVYNLRHKLPFLKDQNVPS